MALGYVDWSPNYKALALGGGGALVGLPLCFWHPSFGAGVIAGTGSIAVSTALIHYLAKSKTESKAAELDTEAAARADAIGTDDTQERPLAAPRRPHRAKELPRVVNMARNEGRALDALGEVFASLDPETAMGLVFADELPAR